VSSLPEYTIRESARARRVSLRVSRRGEIEIVVPRGFNVRTLPRVIERNRLWIDRRLAKAAADRAYLEPEPADGKPTEVLLRAVGESWQVTYAATQSSRATLTQHRASESPPELRISGPVHDASPCREALRRWLRRRATEFLPPRIDSLAAEHGFEFTRVSVRLQKTRWGSCSSSGTISINAKSLFLPPELMDHLLLHELCHTEHGNHSASFHQLLEERSRDGAIRERELKRAWLYVPGWAEE